MKVARTFFSKKERQLIVDAIRTVEKTTSGEIRVHVGNFCFGSEVKCAQKIFTKLNMHHTKDHNAVLIYIAVFHKKIAIIGDVGIHQKLGDAYWEQLVIKLITHFKSKNKGAGLVDIIMECGKQLNTFFPQSNDTNELLNAIDY